MGRAEPQAPPRPRHTHATAPPPLFLPPLGQDRKWVVEHQEGNQGVVISDTQPKHTVYIYGCSNSTIQASRLQPSTG